MKVLVANRGEIACRIIRSCRSLGVDSVAVFSDADRDALHVEMADEAVFIGAAAASESYLAADVIIAAALSRGVDAVHPGYGFLAENAGFATSVLDAGMKWVGPAARVLSTMGEKDHARAVAERAGVPVLPATPRRLLGQLDGVEANADSIGYPLLVKAASGGGGIGMRLVSASKELRSAIESVQSLGSRAFGDATIYLERYVPHARHVEVQVFGFGDGRAIHLFERDCSVQRRFQKVIEEAGAPGLSQDLRESMYAAARSLAEGQRYEGAGTVEFVVDSDRERFYFLEMNTRIQVEHAVTEQITGLDLVNMQLEQVLYPERLTLGQDDVRQRGWSVEARIYAEDPAKGFLPSPGMLKRLEWPEPGDGLRVETGVRQGDTMTQFYDPMIGKMVTHAATRDAARRSLLEALSVTAVEGVKSNLEFLKGCLRHRDFVSGVVSTRFVEGHMSEILAT